MGDQFVLEDAAYTREEVECAFSAIVQPQTYTLDRTSMRISSVLITRIKIRQLHLSF